MKESLVQLAAVQTCGWTPGAPHAGQAPGPRAGRGPRPTAAGQEVPAGPSIHGCNGTSSQFLWILNISQSALYASKNTWVNNALFWSIYYLQEISDVYNKIIQPANCVILLASLQHQNISDLMTSEGEVNSWLQTHLRPNFLIVERLNGIIRIDGNWRSESSCRPNLSRISNIE